MANGNIFGIKNAMQKVLWILITMFFSLQVWLVKMSYDSDKRITLADTKADERKILQDKIFEKVDANNIILQSKTDNKENTDAHERIILKVIDIEKKVDLMYYRSSMAVVTDTNHQNFIAGQVVEKVILVASKIDTLKTILVQDVKAEFPLKDTNLLEVDNGIRPFSVCPIRKH